MRHAHKGIRNHIPFVEGERAHLNQLFRSLNKPYSTDAFADISPISEAFMAAGTGDSRSVRMVGCDVADDLAG